MYTDTKALTNWNQFFVVQGKSLLHFVAQKYIHTYNL